MLRRTVANRLLPYLILPPSFDFVTTCSLWTMSDGPASRVAGWIPPNARVLAEADTALAFDPSKCFLEGSFPVARDKPHPLYNHHGIWRFKFHIWSIKGGKATMTFGVNVNLLPSALRTKRAWTCVLFEIRTARARGSGARTTRP